MKCLQKDTTQDIIKCHRMYSRKWVSLAGQGRWRSNLGPGSRERWHRKCTMKEEEDGDGEGIAFSTRSGCAFSLRRQDTGMPCILWWARKADSVPANLVTANGICSAWGLILIDLAPEESADNKEYHSCIVWNGPSQRWKSWDADFVNKRMLLIFFPILGTSIFNEESGIFP